MDAPHRLFDMDVMTRLERIYRRRLAEEPGDMDARVGLAWCLFIQALYQDGQQSMLTALVAAGDGKEEQASVVIRSIAERDASHLLKDCLKQALTVQQLSPHPQDRSEVEKLQALVKLSGAGRAVIEAEDENARILAEITREIIHGPDVVERP